MPQSGALQSIFDQHMRGLKIKIPSSGLQQRLKPTDKVLTPEEKRLESMYFR